MPTRNLHHPVVIGMGGGTGSGKSALARRVAARRWDWGVSIVDQDSYYKDLGHLSAEARNAINYDEPCALDHDLLFQHFQRLTQGEAVEKPRYSFATHARTVETDRVSPSPLIILEGLYALWDPRLRALIDLKIYLDAGPDVRLIRRIRRDVQERGRTVESVLAQYLNSVRPMHLLHIDPTKAQADLVLDSTVTPLEDLAEAADQALVRVLEARA
jgi:uridine kinase